jgi:hypothetical protein
MASKKKSKPSRLKTRHSQKAQDSQNMTKHLTQRLNKNPYITQQQKNHHTTPHQKKARDPKHHQHLHKKN